MKKIINFFPIVIVIMCLFVTVPVFAVVLPETAPETVKMYDKTIEKKTTEIEIMVEYPTTPIELIIKGDIFEQLVNRNSVVDVSAYNLSETEAKNLLHEVIDENASVINAKVKPEYVVESKYVKQIKIDYEELNLSLMAVTTMSQEVNNILSCIDDSMTDIEKALAVNDYFVTNYCYDETYSIYTKEGMFTNKTGVCAAYSAAYQYIMKDKLGFQCITVTSNGMNHAWNMLNIDGQWYHVDVTWNDPIPDFPGRAVHKYFLLSDNVISDDEHRHYGWTNKHSATSTKFDNYFWTNVETPIIMIDGYYYYIEKESGNVCKRNSNTGEVNEIYTVSSFWPCWNKPGWHWRGNYSQIVHYENTLYINTHNKILSMDLSGGNVKTVVSQNTSEGYIWGLIINGNKIEYFVSRDRWEYGVEKTKSFVFNLNNCDITNFTATDYGVNAYINLNVVNAPVDAIVYVASYDTIGKLLELQNLTLNNGTTKATFSTSSVYKYKVFIWKGNTIRPLTGAKEYIFQ